MQPRTLKEKAAAAKKEIASLTGKYLLTPQSERSDPLHNPIAYLSRRLSKQLSNESKKIVDDFKNSVKLVITPENMKILTQYYHERKTIPDLLGKLYNQISFEDFILRFYNKRFKQVYLDGRVIVARDDVPFYSQYHNAEGREALDLISRTDKKSHGLLAEYLTLEELALSPLVLPQVTSLVIGTGNRSREDRWDVSKEFNESIDVATFSYPAAAEFRDGRTAHYDLLYITVPYAGYSKEQIGRLEAIKHNIAFKNAATAIYGDKFPSIEDYRKNPNDYLTITNGKSLPDNLQIINPQQAYKPKPGYTLLNDSQNPILLFVDHSHNTLWLDCEKIRVPSHAEDGAEISLKAYLLDVKTKAMNEKDKFNVLQKALKKYHNSPAAKHAFIPTHFLLKKAYLNRTKNMLRSMLLSADAEMAELGLGTNYQLKGLGLGAFSFTGERNQLELEKLFKEALKEVLLENPLKHIKVINLINLPSTFEDKEMKQPKLDSIVNGIHILCSNMDPTSNMHEALIGETGATQFCGDSGSFVGNEGNEGLDRSSSDDPAQQYALLDPLIFNPLFNKNLTRKHCIHVCNNHKLERQHAVEEIIEDTILIDEAAYSPKDIITQFNEALNPFTDESVFKYDAIRFISEIKNNDELLELFNTLKNENRSSASASSIFSVSSKPALTAKTWAPLVDAIQARLILNSLSAKYLNHIYSRVNELSEDKKFAELMGFHTTTKWFSRATGVQNAVNDILRCKTKADMINKIKPIQTTFANSLENNLYQAEKEMIAVINTRKAKSAG